MPGRKSLKLLIFASIFILILLAFFLPAHASPFLSSSEPSNLSPFIDIWNDAAENGLPDVAYNPQNNEYMVVWSTKQGPNTTDVWCRRVHASGLPSTWFNLDSSPGVRYEKPAIAYGRQQQEYLAAYVDTSNLAGSNIHARVFRWDGGIINARMDVSVDPNSQDNPAVAYNSLENEFLIVYNSTTPAGTMEIVGRRYRAADHLLLPPVTIASSIANQYRSYADVAYNPIRNTYLITYLLEDVSGGAAGIGVVSRTASFDLMSIGPERDLAMGSPPYASTAVAAGPDEYLVTWSTVGYIYGRLVDGDGFPLGPANGFPIPSAPAAEYHLYPDVSYLGGSIYLATWHYFDGFTSDEGDVYGQYIKARSARFFGSTIDVDTGPNLQVQPSVACSTAGSCLLVYSNNPIDYPGGDTDIGGRMASIQSSYLPMVLR